MYLILTKKMQERIFKIKYGCTPLERCSLVFVYNEKYIICNTAKKKIHQIRTNRDNQSKWIHIFKGQFEEIEPRFIFFGQWYDTEEKYKFQKRLFQYVVDSVANENCCFKLHPSKKDEQMQYLDSINNVISNSSSFEIFNHYHDMSQKVLISVQSTAISSPKLVYNEEPYVIYLYKIYSECFPDSLSEHVLKAGDQLKSVYHQNRVLIPNSVEEFLTLLAQLRE